MKKRKGLIAIIIVCVVSFVATIALGITCMFTIFTEPDNGRIEQALREFADRYHLNVHFDIPGYTVDYYDNIPSVQTPDADNQIDLTVIPQGSDLEIECDNIPLIVRSGDTAAAQLTFAGGSQSLSTDQYRFELFRSRENSSRYVLVFDLTSHLWTNAQVNAQLDVTLPADFINRLDVDSGNGTVTLSGIDCSVLTAESANGSLTAENLNIDQTVDLSTDNGSLTLNNLLGTASVNCDSDNGSIQFSAGSLTSYTIDASADNGRIINNLATPAQTIRGDDLHYERHGADGSMAIGLRFQSDNGRIELNP